MIVWYVVGIVLLAALGAVHKKSRKHLRTLPFLGMVTFDVGISDDTREDVPVI